MGAKLYKQYCCVAIFFIHGDAQCTINIYIYTEDHFVAFIFMTSYTRAYLCS